MARTLHFALHCLNLDVPQGMLATSVAPVESEFAEADVWMGAMVPKRWAKRAVTRNAIKRQIYNVSVDYELALPNAAHVVRLRAGFDRTKFISATSELLNATVRKELQQLFAKAVATR